LVISILRIKQVDLEDYQNKREEEGVSPRTIDYEVSVVSTMITKAFYNDMIGGRTLKAFKTVKKRLKKGSNARKRVVTVEEFLKLVLNASPHLRPIIIVAYNTGRRKGELRKLRWSHIDRENMFIRLPAALTKERKQKNIPINHHVKKVFNTLPHALRHDFVFTF